MGAMLIRAAGTYPGLRKAVVEAVQNALDARATVIYVGIDQAGRRVAVCDNGSGITVEKFGEALSSVGGSIKPPEPGTLGRFGLGMVAPMTKAKIMRIVSQPADAPQANEWTFNSAYIGQQATDLSIPFRSVPELPRLPEPFTHAANEAKPRRHGPRVEWRTMVLLDQITTDRTIANVDIAELAREILTKLGDAMLFRGATVFIKICDRQKKIVTQRVDPSLPTGKKLDVVVVENPKAGRVEFELYRAQQTGGQRHGVVKLAEIGSINSLSFEEFRTQATGAGYYRSEKPDIMRAIKALGSGYFEGKVSAQHVTLDEHRDKFVNDDPFEGLCQAIATWYEVAGQHHYSEERQAREDKRYAELGEQTLSELLALITDDVELSLQFQDLGDVLSTSHPGQAASQANKKLKGEQEPKKTTRSQRHRVEAKPRQNKSASTSQPFFSFAYLALDSLKLWEYDHGTAQLTFNIKHPLWEKLDATNGVHTPQNDRHIKHLQRWLAIELMVLLLHNPQPEDFESARTGPDDRVRLYVESVILRS